MQLVPEFEGKLADWPDALEFYGVDLESAREDSISPQQIAYLVLAVDSQILYCETQGKDLAKHFRRYDYAGRLFSYTRTRAAWTYARRCVSDKYRKQIDSFLVERYGDSYEQLPPV
jgi:hypothetical protein